MNERSEFTRKVAQWLRPFGQDLRLSLTDNAGASQQSWRNASDQIVAWVNSVGDASFADITVNSITIAGGSLDAHTVDLLHAKPSTPHAGEVLTDAHVIATDSTGAANLEATSATIASVLTLSGRTAKQYTTSAHDRLLMRRLVSGTTLADVAALAWGRNSNRRFLNIWVVDTADTLQERALFGEDGGILLGNMAVTRVGTPGDAVHIGGTGQPITATRQQLNILEYTTSPGVGTGGGVCFKGSFSAGSPGTLVEYAAIVGKRETAGSGVYGYIGFGTRGTEITNQVTERARITYQGHLLINTTTDDVYHLDVNGAIRGTSITLGAQTANYVFAGPASGAAAAPAFRALVDADMPGGAGTYFLLAGRSGGQYGYGGTDSGDDLTLESTSHATKGYVLIQPNGGRVGIGTTTPNWLVEIDGDAAILSIRRANNAAENRAPGVFYYRAKGTPALPATVVNGTYLSKDETYGYDGGTFIRFAARAFIASDAAGNGRQSYMDGSLNELFSILTSGRVGIGTTSPNSILHVATSTSVPVVLGAITDDADKGAYLVSTQYDTSAEPEGWLVFGGFSAIAEHRLMIGGGGSAFNAATNIRFFTAADVVTRAGTERARIDSAGNFGVGTISPGARLQVNGDVSGITAIFRANATTPGNLTQWQDSGGNVLASVLGTGEFGMGITPETRFQLYAYKATASAVTQAHATVYGLLIATPGADTAGTYTGLTTDVRAAGAFNFSSASALRGQYAYVRHTGSGLVTGVQCIQTGGVLSSSGNVSAWAGVDIVAPTFSSTGVITAIYGVNVGANTTAGVYTSKFGVYIGAQTGAATNNYAIYCAGTTDSSYFGGSVGIGKTAPSTKLHVLLSSAATNAVANVLTVGHNSTGTAAAGFGVGQLFTLESSTTGDTSAGLIEVLWATATHASRKARMVMSVYDTAVRECLRMEASGAAAMLGFFGVSAIARPTTGSAAATFVQNSGNAVNDASTFDGYTLLQVVKALRDLGLLT